jgi:S1-C subfamily serine protease
VITEWNGFSIQDVADFRMKVAAVVPGQKVQARILRGGRSHELEFVLEDRADHITVASDRGTERPFIQSVPAPSDEGAPEIGRPEPRSRNESPGQDPAEPGSALLGMTLEPLGSDMIERFGLAPEVIGPGKGLVITGFESRLAFGRPLKVGDIITKVDRYRIGTIDDFRRAADLLEGREGAILYHIIRDGRSTIIAVKP